MNGICIKDEVLEKIIDTAKVAGRIIYEADRSDIGIKDKEGRANFVTAFDVKVQKFLEEELLKILPGASFLGEEDGDNKEIEDSEYLFIVDPIDGTTNFIKDYKISCVSIGLLKNGERYIGVVHNPYLDETFYAIKNKGAYLNDRKIKVSEEDLCNGIVLFGSAPYNVELSKKSFELAYEYFNKSLDIRRSGSAALDLCAVASGRAELFFEMLLSPWDFAAGALIVQEAGGIVTTIEGNTIETTLKCSVLARNK